MPNYHPPLNKTIKGEKSVFFITLGQQKLTFYVGTTNVLVAANQSVKKIRYEFGVFHSTV